MATTYCSCFVETGAHIEEIFIAGIILHTFRKGTMGKYFSLNGPHWQLKPDERWKSSVQFATLWIAGSSRPLRYFILFHLRGYESIVVLRVHRWWTEIIPTVTFIKDGCKTASFTYVSMYVCIIVFMYFCENTKESIGRYCYHIFYHI